MMLSDRQKVLLVLALAVALGAAGTALALAIGPPKPQPEAQPEHGMLTDDRCAHMPEHCEGGGADG